MDDPAESWELIDAEAPSGTNEYGGQPTPPNPSCDLHGSPRTRLGLNLRALAALTLLAGREARSPATYRGA